MEFFDWRAFHNPHNIGAIAGGRGYPPKATGFLTETNCQMGLPSPVSSIALEYSLIID
jgi:hypothetical protein